MTTAHRWSLLWGGLAISAILVIVAGLSAYSAAWIVPLPERLEAKGSTVVLYDDGSVAHAFLSEDEKWRMHSELEEIDPRYIQALIQFEDQRFWHHPGVDPVALIRALAQDIWHLEVVSGASTLTANFMPVRLSDRP